MAQKDEQIRSSAASKQLLYSEMFGDCLEEKLKVTGQRKQMTEPMKTFRPPPSLVLSRVRDFLPQLASANERLQSLPASDICIEDADEHDGPMIEMSLALVPGMPSDAEDNEETEDDSCIDSDSSADVLDDETTESTNVRSPKKQKAAIEVLPDSDVIHVTSAPDG